MRFFISPIIFVGLSLGIVAAEKPNVVVIIADDLGYADMSFLPQAPADVKRFGTPGLDKLARTGTYFKNGYGTSPICSPSRAGLITGRYQQRWGNYSYNEGGLPLAEQTIPEALLKAGYTTAKYGKTHLNGGPKKYPTRHGFEESLGFMFHTWDYIRLSQKDVEAYQQRDGFKGNFGCQVVGPLLKATALGTKPEAYEKVSFENSFSTKIFTDKAVEYIRKKKSGRPFYLHIAYNAVHMPTYVVDKKWAEKVGARYVEWNRDAEEWGYPYWEPNRETHQLFHKKWGHMGEIDKDGRRAYLSNLLALDFGVSQILTALEQTGQRENTIVFFISDNGGTINTYANNAPLRGYKYMLGEGGIRVPFIVSMPGSLPQNVVNEKAIISTMDIFPTILDLAGEDIPGNLDGRSLLPVLMGEREDHHPYLAWALNRDRWVLRMGPWKLTNGAGWRHRDFEFNEQGDVVGAAKDFTYSNEPQLFNLENDIGETANLIDQYPEVVAEMREQYRNWDQQMPGPLTPEGKPKKKKK
ncbi:Arylsulfatase [Pontiella desulfatans]|uniref:Arylsulfatase n=1 Tax=Pontiella desulfatans TaxID=2750659 RepID=A0A6C2TWE1_PONDE|nr:sulfatase-like hydrolase/transferase [Pontiella desulfatans]SPS73639.1 sulfatase S1_40 [Kiritimatiellales bacterium]VGO11995.1 Arylsulfatase [Pontiella desulfatans]